MSLSAWAVSPSSWFRIWSAHVNKVVEAKADEVVVSVGVDGREIVQMPHALGIRARAGCKDAFLDRPGVGELKKYTS